MKIQKIINIQKYRAKVDVIKLIIIYSINLQRYKDIP
jgi:hypothetical protein